MLRHRLLRALLVVVVTLAVETVIWHLFVTRSFWRELFMYVAAVVALAGLFALWRALRPRTLAERRAAERRRAERRARRGRA